MNYLYPNGLKKALTFSYDDGRDYDRKLVSILNKYGLKGTFHLNSGTLGKHGYVGSEEIASLYAGHEVSCHGFEHKNLPQLNEFQMNLELREDRRALEALSGQMVQGMSYAYGGYCETAEQVARANGLKYSRTTRSTMGFSAPADFMEWHPTCHHNSMLALADKFLNDPGKCVLPMLYVWGHSYEFGIPDQWEDIEAFAAKVSGKDDIWYATNIEICNYVSATRAQEFSADGKRIYNPTALSVWVQNDGKVFEVRSGECVYIG